MTPASSLNRLLADTGADTAKPSRLDEIKGRLALLYVELGQATAKGDVRRVAELQSQIKALIRERANP
jgi:hypothetical protein